jgi:hypothetical protein
MEIFMDFTEPVNIIETLECVRTTDDPVTPGTR